MKNTFPLALTFLTKVPWPRVLQAESGDLARSLFGEIEKVVTDYGKANGFAAIVAKKELLYQGSIVTVQDVTEDILKLVNEKGQKK